MACGVGGLEAAKTAGRKVLLPAARSEPDIARPRGMEIVALVLGLGLAVGVVPPVEAQPQGGRWCVYPKREPRAAERAMSRSLVSHSEVEPNDTPGTAQDIPLGRDAGQARNLDISATISPATDADYYRLDATKGDIIGLAGLGGGIVDTVVAITDLAGTPIITNDDHSAIATLYPPSSPFPGGEAGTDSALTLVVPSDGQYLVRVTSHAGASSGPYTLRIRIRRPALEAQGVSAMQTIFLDFDGATINPNSIFGFGPSSATLSPLTSYLDAWGLSPDDQHDVINAVIDTVAENFNDLRIASLNGDRDTDFTDGHFDVEILNSRDHTDPFGKVNVSRAIIGGSISELGIATIGIAESVDPGNFATTETAVILLDELSAPSPDPDSINTIPRDSSFSIIDAVGRIVGNIVSHEIGHYLGNLHTDEHNAVNCLMDTVESGWTANLGGVGADGILGTADDLDTDYVPDAYHPLESPALGLQRTNVRTAFALATGALHRQFSQPPTDSQGNIASNVDWTDGDPNVAVADDFVSDGRPITSVRWWGSTWELAPASCTVTNGGFEAGGFSGWTATTNGLAEFLPWTIGPAGTCDPQPFHCSAPMSGTFDAMNGFDGEAGLEYELYQDVLLPPAETITLATSHRIQYDSQGASSSQPRELDISLRDTSNILLSELYHEDVFLNGAPYTDLGWNTQVFDISAYAGDTVRIHFRMFVPETSTGPALIEFDDIFLSCDSAGARRPLSDNGALEAGSCGPGAGDCCAANMTPGCDNVDCCSLICGMDWSCCNAGWDDICAEDAVTFCDVCTGEPVAPIDGWLVSFHEPLNLGSLLGEPLGVYFCPPERVRAGMADIASCDGYRVLDYAATLSDCCLITARADSRSASVPARADAFYEEECFRYNWTVQAVVGRRFVEETVSASLVGRWYEYGGAYADVWAEGNYAYVPNWTLEDGASARVHILDISNPAIPTLVNTFMVPEPNHMSSPQDVKISDGLLFISLDGDGNDGVAIVDVRSPPDASLAATIRVPGFEDTHNIFLDSGYLYMVDNNTPRVAIVDLTGFDPDNPPLSPITEAKWIMTDVGDSRVADITVGNGRLYAAAWDSGLWIYDVSDVDSTMPVLLGNTIGTATQAAWPTDDGKFVVTAEARAGGGIRVYEVEDAGNSLTLVLRDSAALPSEAYSAHTPVVIGNRLYVSWYQAGLRVFDIDPAGGTLEPVAGYDTCPLTNNGELDGHWGVYPFLGDDKVLLTDIGQGFFLVDITTESTACVGFATGHTAEEDFWGWYTADLDGGAGPALMSTITTTAHDQWLYGPWQAASPNCGAANMASILLTPSADVETTCACVFDDDCGDLDPCTLDECSAGSCSNTGRRYGDVDGNGTISIFDLFCVLNGFGGTFPDCAFVNVDIDPCPGNASINVFDLFAVLNSFGGDNPCGCPPGPQ